MRLIPMYSRGGPGFLNLVDALARYCVTPQELEDYAARIWPGVDVDHGHTHLRLTVASSSAYVDLEPERAAAFPLGRVPLRKGDA